MVAALASKAARSLLLLPLSLSEEPLAEPAAKTVDKHHDAYATYYTKAASSVSLADVLRRTAIRQSFGGHQGSTNVTNGTVLPTGRQGARILGLGCGFSYLPEEMIQDGWGGIDCIDHSAKAGEWMTDHWRSLGIEANGRMKYIVGDMFEEVERLSSTSAPGTYAMALDKGTLEGQGQKNKEKLVRLFENLHFLLPERGVYVQIGPFAPYGEDDQGWRLSGTWAPSTWPQWRETVEVARRRSDSEEAPVAVSQDLATLIGRSCWTLVDVVSMTNSLEYCPHPPAFWVYIAQRALISHAGTSHDDEL